MALFRCQNFHHSMNPRFRLHSQIFSNQISRKCRRSVRDKSIRQYSFFAPFSWFGKRFSSKTPHLAESPRYRQWMMKERTIWGVTQCPSSLAAHISFILLAISYGFSDMLHLRCLAVLSGIFMMFYNRWHPHGRPLWLPFRWNFMFCVINAVHIGLILDLERRSKNISRAEAQLYDTVFFATGLSQVDYMKLLNRGKFVKFKVGDKLTVEGTSNNRVYLIAHGGAKVIVNDKLVYELSEHQFVGEMGIAVGLRISTSLKSAASVEITKPTECLIWTRGALIDLLEENPDIAKGFQAAVSLDLARKALNGRGKPSSEDGADQPHTMNSRNFAQYVAILTAILSDGKTLPHERNILKRFRYLHLIEDSEHSRLLKERGWTDEEFENGAKESILKQEQEQNHPVQPAPDLSFFD
uniref:Penicillin-resistant dd-carboxypeptidase n=1 Tax=Hirondellea gigas TaxID=1518452 RepID=A0A6A7G877_9CRUS